MLLFSSSWVDECWVEKAVENVREWNCLAIFMIDIHRIIYKKKSIPRIPCYTSIFGEG